MYHSSFDPSRAFMMKRDMFRRFRVTGEGQSLARWTRLGRIKPEDELLVIERGGRRLAFSVNQLEYHQVAEGELGGQPYLVGYCGICQSATSLVPLVDGAHLHFGARGIYNGLPLIGDDETGSYWSYITGECLHGELVGEQLQLYPLERVTVSYAMNKWPELHVALSRPHIMMRLMTPIKRLMGKHTYIPPMFRFTLGQTDSRLPREAPGLGLIGSRGARFYPVRQLLEQGIVEDQWEGRPIRVAMDTDRAYPLAVFTDEVNNESSLNWPMQLYTRWYGFSLTFPKCDLYAAS